MHLTHLHRHHSSNLNVLGFICHLPTDVVIPVEIVGDICMPRHTRTLYHQFINNLSAVSCNY